MQIRYAILGVLMMLPIISWADGRELLQSCEAVEFYETMEEITVDRLDMGRCIGFVQGVFETLVAIRELNGADRCIPGASVENIENIKIVNAYLRSVPKELHKPEISLALLALTSAYPSPCNKGN